MLPADVPLQEPGAGHPTITVLLVVDERDASNPVWTELDANEQFDRRTVTSATAALGHLGTVDCVVCEGRMATTNGFDLLDTVRAHEPDLPIVLVVDWPHDEFDEAHDGFGEARDDLEQWVRATAWTDVVWVDETGAVTTRLARRIHQLVGHQRARALARRALAAVESSRDGIAIVSPDGAFEFVSRSFATRFDYDGDELIGAPWRDVYTEDEVERLTSTALPSVEDGWRWAGTCTGRRRLGETFTVQTCIVGLDDGSLVFAVYDTHG